MLLALVEARFPNATLLLEPALRRVKRVGTQLARANAANLAGGDHLTHLKHADMFHEAWQGHLMAPRKIANAGWAGGKLRDDCAAGAIRQGMKDAIKVSHMAN